MRSPIAWPRAASARDVDHVAFYDKPFLKFERLLETYLAFAPKGLPLLPHGDPALAQGEAVPEAAAARRAARLRSRLRLGGQAAVHRASPEPRGIRILSLAVRGSGDPDHGRSRRVGDHVGRLRTRQSSGDAQGTAFPAFARAALFGIHLLHRLQGQLRRIQGDGACALRRAEICPADSRQPRSTSSPTARSGWTNPISTIVPACA